jgi:CheY-like chemotaxis protein
MTFKRALVVDDSRSARMSLKRLLEEQGLSVALADCGEAALDHLKHDLVDVIFMDHTMPGMTGLEALSAIKGNPRTATIPVMMYTTKEGEVYVSQARAFGAVGVLPKQFQPHVLFDMLLELGLVTDRRASKEDDGGTARAPAADDTDPDRAYEQQALGMSVQTLVTRILEDQHVSLRADILQSHKDFAKQVAAEVYAQQRADREAQATTAPAEPERRFASQIGAPLAAICLTAAIIVLAVLYWRTLEERNAALGALDAAASSAAAVENAVRAADAAARARAETASPELLGTLTWAVNETGNVGFDELPFDASRAEQLRGLLDRLATARFRGTVVLESHLGQFCLVSDETGSYRLADPDSPLAACTLFGHPLDDSSFAAERQTPEFREFLETTSLPPGIELRIVAHDRTTSVPRMAYPEDAETAGAWNAVAARNNRVEYSLVPRT